MAPGNRGTVLLLLFRKIWKSWLHFFLTPPKLSSFNIHSSVSKTKECVGIFLAANGANITCPTKKDRIEALAAGNILDRGVSDMALVHGL